MNSSLKHEKSTFLIKNSIVSLAKEQDLIDVERVEKLRLALKIACFEYSFNLVKIQLADKVISTPRGDEGELKLAASIN